MYYLNARMYDSKTARFLQEDTYLGDRNDPLSLNLYTYSHNEPLMYTDPTGHLGQHIYSKTIIGWADVALSGSNIYLKRIKGDVNNDSVVDALDFALMKMYLLGQTANINKINSDIDLDGEIDAIDFT